MTECREEGRKGGVKIHRNLLDIGIKRRKCHWGPFLAQGKWGVVSTSKHHKNWRNSNNKGVGQMGEERICGGGSNYHFIKVEFETLRRHYGRQRVDRWIEVWICGKMSRIKIEDWSHQELKSWEEMRSLWKSSQHENSGSRMDIWRIP